ncbi:MAG: hypothetical protein WCK90_01390 [archaeon]
MAEENEISTGKKILYAGIAAAAVPIAAGVADVLLRANGSDAGPLITYGTTMVYSALGGLFGIVATNNMSPMYNTQKVSLETKLAGTATGLVSAAIPTAALQTIAYGLTRVLS